VRDIVEDRRTSKISKKFSINRVKLKRFSGSLPDDKELERLFLEFLTERFGGWANVMSQANSNMQKDAP